MKKIWHNKQEFMFWLSAALLTIIMAAYAIYGLRFLAQKIDAAFFEDFGAEQLIIEFDFDKFNQAVSDKILP